MTPQRNGHPAADSPGHREAQDALPWLANRTLSGPALERVWAHVQACPQCRADLAQMHTWRHAVQGVQGAVERGCDPERALARLRPVLDAPAAPPQCAAAAPARLVVLFRPETTEREMRRIVRANGARIVGGPTAADAYLLDTDADPTLVVDRLHGEAAVTWAEPFTRKTRP